MATIKIRKIKLPKRIFTRDDERDWYQSRSDYKVLRGKLFIHELNCAWDYLRDSDGNNNDLSKLSSGMMDCFDRNKLMEYIMDSSQFCSWFIWNKDHFEMGREVDLNGIPLNDIFVVEHDKDYYDDESSDDGEK